MSFLTVCFSPSRYCFQHNVFIWELTIMGKDTEVHQNMPTFVGSTMDWRDYLFPKQALVFTCLQKKSFENTMGKGEIARSEQFLLFPQCFLPFWRTFCNFYQNWNCLLQTLSVSMYYSSSIQIPSNQTYCLTHSHTTTPFDAPGKQASWKQCGKRRNCL